MLIIFMRYMSKHNDARMIFEAQGEIRLLVKIETVVFSNKQNIPWNDVEVYLKRFVGETYEVNSTGDQIVIAGDFPDEYTESRYTKKLRGALAKAKANAATVIPEMIKYAENRRWIENKEEKHAKDAPGGWYRYDSWFGLPVQASQENEERINTYRATLVVRIKNDKLYLYDILDIKKEASTPLES